MALFQKSVLNQYLVAQDKAAIEKAYKRFTKYFHNSAIQENIKGGNEEQFQAKFLDELFVAVFGYTMFPKEPHNLVTEFKNLKGAKKADGAILVDGKALAVIELKGMNTKDLESIRRQAFDYKSNHPTCVYIISSNFEKLRFYIQTSDEYEEFNLFSLSEERFELMYLCLAKDNLLGNIPLKIKEASGEEEEAITKKFYKDYSFFKRELYRDLVKQNMRNEVFRSELDKEDTERAAKNIKQALFKKSQSLIDRFLFIFFAEDRGLLPLHSTIQILDKWKSDVDFGDSRPLLELFRQYFTFLDLGRKGTESRAEIFAYNGGLFKPDPIIDSLLISDDLLYEHAKALQAYDFESQVDVNILGHIFENSLNEIESINADIEEGEFVEQTSKRKKDGVFYTPKYITKYIVQNTVGELCTDKKIQLGISEEEYLKSRKGRPTKTLKALQERLEEYRKWLLSLTICDPACGSGAFLNQALDFLIGEHEYLDGLQRSLLGGGFHFPNIENTVLEKNIFGVDINEESVEIAKLSLWLRTAQPRRKLNDLSSNIKCGNSLIDIKAIGGDKAFNWKEEFQEIDAKGGFDVVIGNPPYVHLEAIKAVSEDLSRMNYITYDKRGDLYPLFVEQGMNILKKEGVISYIMPNKWLQAGYGKNLREYFLSKRLNRLIDFGDIQIFKGATTYPCIFIAKNEKPQRKLLVSILKSSGALDFEQNVNMTSEEFETANFSGETWVISSKAEKNLLAHLSRKFDTLSQSIGKGFYYGIKTGLSEAFLIDADTKDEIIQNDAKASEFIHPFLQGRDVQPYTSPKAYNYLILFEKGFTKGQIGECSEEEGWEWLKKTYPSISNWLLPFMDRGKKRTDKGDFWWEVRACDYYSEFLKPKIMYQAFQVKPCFVYDESGLYCNNSMWLIPTEDKAMVGVLNSKMGWWLITKYCTQIQNGCQLIWKYFGQIPIPEVTNPELLVSVEKMLELKNAQQSTVSVFTKYLKSKYYLESLNRKLQNWYELEFGEFSKELNKAIKKHGGTTPSPEEEMKWMTTFDSKKVEVENLITRIDETDKEIDQMVYNLYGLSKEEIAIIEGVQ